MYTEDGERCKMLIDEGHAVEYWGGKKTEKSEMTEHGGNKMHISQKI